MTEKLYPRKLIPKLLKYLDSREAIVVYGARQVGKTHLLTYLMEHHLSSNSFYLDLELPLLLELCNRGPESMYEYLLQKGADSKQKTYVLIDEIQYLDNPTNFVKLAHDHFPQLKLILSGSSTFEIRKKFKESLTGRTINFELYPLNFEEFLTFKEKHFVLSSENNSVINAELLPLAEEFIKYGGYPKIVLEPSEEKKQAYLHQIIDTYVKKDIRDLGNIRNISAFNKLMEILASQSGKLLNISELASTTGINQITLVSYLDLLEKTFIVKRITPFHKNLRSELYKNPKVFLLDTGMMHLLWLKEFPKIISGEVFETFVFTELIKYGARINFWRTITQQEVDFIISEKELYAIEVKLNFASSSVGGLKSFVKEYICKNFIVGLSGEKKGKYPWELIKTLEG